MRCRNRENVKYINGIQDLTIPGKRESPKTGTGCRTYVCLSVGNAGNSHEPPVQAAKSNQPGGRQAVSPFKSNTL